MCYRAFYIVRLLSFLSSLCLTCALNNTYNKSDIKQMITCTCRDLVSNPALAKLPHVAKYVARKKLDVAVAKYEIQTWSSFKRPRASARLDKLVMVTDATVTTVMTVVTTVMSITRIPPATACPFQDQS